MTRYPAGAHSARSIFAAILSILAVAAPIGMALAQVPPQPQQTAARGAGRGGAQGRPAAMVQSISQLLNDLNLTADQHSRVQVILAAARQQGRGIMQEMAGATPAERRQKFGELINGIEEKIKPVLDPSQTSRFEQRMSAMKQSLGIAAATPASQPTTAPQAAVQPGGARGARGAAGGRGDAAPRLGVVLERLRDYLDQITLTDDQKEQVTQLFNQTRRQLLDLEQQITTDRATLQAKSQSVIQEMRRQLGAILTPQQTERLRDLVNSGGPLQAPRGAERGEKGASGGGNEMQPTMDGKPAAASGAAARGATAAAAVAEAPEIPLIDVGKPAPDFKLGKIDSQSVQLASLKGKLVLLVFGSYSSPIFRQRASGLESLAREYGPRCNPIVIYTRENYPAGGWEIDRNKDDGVAIEQPKDMNSRLAQAKRARSELKLTIPVAVDTLDDATARAYGGLTNAAYLIGRDGNVLFRQKWFEPYAMKQAIDQALQGTGRLANEPRSPANLQE